MSPGHVEAAALSRGNLTGGFAAVTPADLRGEVARRSARILIGDMRYHSCELRSSSRTDIPTLGADRGVADRRCEVHGPVGRAVRRVGDAALVRPFVRVGVGA